MNQYNPYMNGGYDPAAGGMGAPSGTMGGYNYAPATIDQINQYQSDFHTVAPGTYGGASAGAANPYMPQADPGVPVGGQTSMYTPPAAPGGPAPNAAANAQLEQYRQMQYAGNAKFAGQGGGQGQPPRMPSGYTNPTGANGYPPGYDASNTDPATMRAYGYGPQGGAPSGQPPSMGQYGYGNRPGQGGGYYQQETPMGSFAAANQQGTGPTQYANNPYIGKASAAVSGGNPYLGGSAGEASASSNPYAGMNNPYTTQAIDAASADAARNYNLYTTPQRDAQMARSGSFGNTGVQQMQLEDSRNFGNTLGNIANSARMSDLNRQQDMGEAAANRQTGVSQFNVGARAGDLNRNLAGTFTGQGLNLQGIGMDGNLAQGMGMFNAGQGNSMNMFNAGQGNAMNMFNAGQGNNMLSQGRSLAQGDFQFARNMDQRGREFEGTMGQRKDEFNQTMDNKVYNDNMSWMDRGQNNQMNFIDKMMGYQGQGVGATNAQQAQPIKDWATFSQVAQGLGGLGNITQEQFEADPVLGMIAGYLAANKKP